jgi:hypothetical protein
VAGYEPQLAGTFLLNKIKLKFKIMEKVKGDFGFFAEKMHSRHFHAQLRFSEEIRSMSIRIGLDLAVRRDLTGSLFVTS